MIADTPDSVATPLALDFDLLRKYDRPGPRYTSYPTAPKFTETADQAALLDAVARENLDPERPLSLYFHLPFCESRCWFCGCTTVITRRHDVAGDYLDHLERELDLMQPWLNSARRVTQLHFGGGSPTFLAPAEIRRLGEMIHARHQFTPDAEISVEIDPRRLTPAQAQAYHDLGCRRASLGVQDTDPRVQVAIHRVQPLAQTREAVRVLRDTGYTSLGIDLIYGLPYQTEASFARTIDEVLSLRPDRLSVFSYAHVPWIKPAQKILERDQALPSPELKLRLFELALRRLTAAGLVHIGMDHFARPEDELAAAARTDHLHRNFQGYSTRAGASLHAFGMSAISQTEHTYHQNTRDLAAYREAVSAGRLPIERGLVLTDEDRRRRTIIMRVMCDRRVDFADLSARIGTDFETAYAPELASLDDLAADGLLRRVPGALEITPAGAVLRRIIAMRFDPSLAADETRYSRTI
ncbi:MAG: oxygen-independent coproporphyrinogen III oxidase [Opitutaceae bacterium]|jgi:oxygen-independent coproporphyrinogen-3 oxidase|nr:oxygen-independent coproporphyrinogen III oxidase [Opitutaceae bacterium]